MANLRTNIKVKIKQVKNGEILSKRWITIRYSDSLKRFGTLTTENAINKIKFDKGIKCDLNVYYDLKKEFINRGVYSTKHDCLYAFKCFMEKDLIMDFWDKVLLPKRPLQTGLLERIKRTGFQKSHNVPPKK